MKSPIADGEARPTRERLVRVAVRLFQTRGYHATGITEILRAAEVPKGSLYHHFPEGKQALAIAAVDWLTREIVSYFDRAAERQVSADRLIGNLFGGAADWLAQHDYATGALISVLTQEAGPDEAGLAASLTTAYERIIAAMAAALAAGQNSDDGAVFRPLAQTVLATLEGTIPLARAARSGEAFTNALKILRPILP